MLNREEIAKNWKRVIEIYKETIEKNNPQKTVDVIVEEFGFEDTVETFAAIAKIKKHDGRIYGKNREWMTSIPLTEDVDEWGYNNPITHCNLDYIHTTHIDNMITQLRKMRN